VLGGILSSSLEKGVPSVFFIVALCTPDFGGCVSCPRVGQHQFGSAEKARGNVRLPAFGSGASYSPLAIRWVGLRISLSRGVYVVEPGSLPCQLAWRAKLCGRRSVVLGPVFALRDRDVDEMVFIDPS
jgi:hypothetical protein